MHIFKAPAAHLKAMMLKSDDSDWTENLDSTCYGDLDPEKGKIARDELLANSTPNPTQKLIIKKLNSNSIQANPSFGFVLNLNPPYRDGSSQSHRLD